MKDSTMYVTMMVTLMLTASVGTVGWSLEPPASQDVAMDAYNLRMKGNMAEAIRLLQQFIQDNPDSAPAQYEIARAQYHMALGNPRELSSLMEDSQTSIGRAIAIDPNNVMHHLFAGHIATIRGYMAMHAQENGSAAKEQYAMACEAYKSALSLNSDYSIALLYLVELYGTLPEEVGGDKAIAEKYVTQLEEADEIFGAKAHSLLLQEDDDKVSYWKAKLNKHEGNADVLEELGKAYLSEDKVDDAVSCFEEAVKTNPKKAYLFLDLSIYHTFLAMGARSDPEVFKTNAILGEAAVTKYLESDPVQPMRAYALAVRSKYKSYLGENEKAQKLFEQAKSLDGNFPKATGLPHPDLFIPPGEISQQHRYLMRRF